MKARGRLEDQRARVLLSIQCQGKAKAKAKANGEEGWPESACSPARAVLLDASAVTSSRSSFMALSSSNCSCAVSNFWVTLEAGTGVSGGGGGEVRGARCEV